MPTKKLLEFIASDNIAADLNEHQLSEISEKVLMDLRADQRSMEQWLRDADRAMELTRLERSPKHTPFRNSANIKHPIISTAALQFSSRTLPELIKNGEVAKYRIIGNDPDGRKVRKGNRLKTHLNWQILEKMPHWLDERDKLHQQLAVVGTAFTKTWFDPVLEVNRSELVPYDLLVLNNGVRSLEEAPRVSQFMYLSRNEIVEQMRYGLYNEEDLDTLAMDLDDPEAIDHELVEQHRWLDLDDDGYEEPYIVTIHRASGKVLRIVARYTAQDILYNTSNEVKRIRPIQYFSDYHFIPSPNGEFFSVGFGTLLLDINETTNTILNQLIDAGHLANAQGGIISKDLRIRKEDLELERGEWIVAESATGNDLKENIFPFNYKEPSMVLYQLMGTLIETAKELTSTTEALTGMADTTNTSPNTLFALIDQGLKVYGAIQRRIFRGFKKELQKLVRLNSQYVNVQEYLMLIDPTAQEIQEMFDPQTGRLLDYDLEMVDVVPVADGNMSTEAENQLRMRQEVTVGMPLIQAGAVNPRQLARNAFNALQTPNIDQLVMPEPDPNAPNPEMIKLQSELDMRAKKLQLEDRDMRIKEIEAQVGIKETMSKALKNIADAEAAEAGTQLEVYKQAFAQLTSLIDMNQNIQETITRPTNAPSAQ